MSGIEDTSGKKKFSKAENIVQFAVFGVCGIIFLICAIWLIFNITDKIKGENLYNQTLEEFQAFIPGEGSDKELYTEDPLPSSSASMQTLLDRLSSGTTDSSEGTNEYSEQLANMRASITALKDVNPDVYG